MEFKDFATKLTIYEAYEKVNNLEFFHKQLSDEYDKLKKENSKLQSDLQEYKAEAERLRNIDYLRGEKK